jgi:uncharacterized damage-inducible protein DinB
MKPAKLIQYWDQIRSALLATIEKFSDNELDNVAFDGGYTVRQIILHIAQEEYGEIHYGIMRRIHEFPPPYEPEQYSTIPALIALLASVHDETLSYLEKLQDGDLEQEIEAGWGGSFMLMDMLWHVMEHEIHHRGELSLILGMLGREGLDA